MTTRQLTQLFVGCILVAVGIIVLVVLVGKLS